MSRSRFVGWLVCMGAVACEGTDETRTQPLPCLAGAERPECLVDASVPRDADTDGSIAEIADATVDASAPIVAPTDATAPDGALADATPVNGSLCVNEDLEDYPAEWKCLAGAACQRLDGAVDYLRERGERVIARRDCQAEDGTSMVSVGYAWGLSSTAYIYEASTGELVVAQVISDYGEFCEGSVTTFSRVPRASTGALVLDCGFESPAGDAHCWETDAGEFIAGWDGGTPETCIFGD